MLFILEEEKEQTAIIGNLINNAIGLGLVEEHIDP